MIWGVGAIDGAMDELADRMAFAIEPLGVLELCAGMHMSGSYGILVDMGYRIAAWGVVPRVPKVGSKGKMCCNPSWGNSIGEAEGLHAAGSGGSAGGRARGATAVPIERE